MSVHPVDGPAPNHFLAHHLIPRISLPHVPVEIGTDRPSPWSASPTYTTLVAVDISAFGDGRDEDVQLHMRTAMYQCLAEAFAVTHLPWIA